MSAATIRDQFLITLDHIERTRVKLSDNTGPRSAFRQPDQHKLAEGLFLSAWTHWEEFLRKLFIEDLATLPHSGLNHEIRNYRTKGARYRLAAIMVDHPDERRFVEWSVFKDIIPRADVLIGNPNRFRTVGTAPGPGVAAPLNQNDLELLKRIRNAIAHKSDYAWQSFRGLVSSPPFNLAPRQRRGITTGRFLTAHNWNGTPVLAYSISIFRHNAQLLVP